MAIVFVMRESKRLFLIDCRRYGKVYQSASRETRAKVRLNLPSTWHRSLKRRHCNVSLGDLSDAIKEPLYEDMVHLDPLGNEIAANHIAECMKRVEGSNDRASLREGVGRRRRRRSHCAPKLTERTCGVYRTSTRQTLHE